MSFLKNRKVNALEALYIFITKTILFSKQFGFSAGQLTDTIIELVDETTNKFKENKYTITVFIDHLKAFYTVDHKILTKKMDIYGLKDRNVQWFQSYLPHRKQYVI